MTKILNFTPHPITIVDGENKVTRTIESSGLIRLAAKTVSSGTIDNVPVTKTAFGEPEGLPNFVEGTFIIVSQLVKSAFSRSDLLVPAEVVRDKEGNIIGCKSLGL